ncbi:MAG: class I SAM-dependent methyltransferase [Myxococcales bacterium]
MSESTPFRWSEVSGTLLLTLHARALESRSKQPVLKDPKAVEIARALEPVLRDSPVPIHQRLARGKLPGKLPVTMSLRARAFDRLTTAWLAEHPAGAVVSLGCGLDSRFERIDDGKARWFELDLPDVIEVRRRFYAEGPRRKFLARSALDVSWMEELREFKGQPILILAEGLFMYLDEKSLTALVSALRREFPGSTLVCELANRWIVERMERPWMRRKFQRQLGIGKEAAFSFGVRDARELEAWAEGVRLVHEWSYFDEKEPKLGWFAWFAGLDFIRRLQWTAVYRLG